jgi:hypothetical protein
MTIWGSDGTNANTETKSEDFVFGCIDCIGARQTGAAVCTYDVTPFAEIHIM